MRAMSDCTPDDVLQFWFPPVDESDYGALAARMIMWFRGGMDAEILARFVPLTEQAANGSLDSWALHPYSRLALILALDQFPRTVYRGTSLAYAQDSKARSHVRDGLLKGHYASLRTLWEKTFFMLPLGHSESL